MSIKESVITFNPWMLFSFAAASWAIAVGGHELIGHGGICAIDTGCEWVSANGMYFDGTRKDGAWGNLIRAGGSIFNVLLGLFAAFWLFKKTPSSSKVQLFLWVLMTINLFQAGSYIGFGWMIHEGMDWAILSHKLFPQGTGETVVSIIGISIILMAIYLCRKLLPNFQSLKLKFLDKLYLIIVPYITSMVVSVSASILVPHPDRWLMISGGIGGSLGFLFWMLIVPILPTPDNQLVQNESGVEFNLGVFIGCVLLGLAYIFILGPGINFS